MPKLLRTPSLLIEDFLSSEDHAALLAWTMENTSRFESSMVLGKTVDESKRKSAVLRDMGPLKRVFKDRVRADYKEWVRELRASDFELSGTELEIVAHNDGAHFQFHTDTVLKKIAEIKSLRVLSAVYYFHNHPKPFDGGLLRLFPFGTTREAVSFGEAPPQEFVPTDNTLVIFPSWAPHDVTPVAVPSTEFRDSRFAVNCWLHRANPQAQQP